MDQSPMDEVVRCPMCSSQNTGIMWTTKHWVRPYLREDGKITATTFLLNAEDMGDEKLVCFDCGHNKEKVEIVWE